MRVVAEAPSNLVHQIFVDIDGNLVDIEENPLHILFLSDSEDSDNEGLVDHPEVKMTTKTKN